MMKNKIAGEIGFLKARRCTMVIDATDWEKRSDGFYLHEARIVEIYYTSHPEVAVQMIPAGYKDQFFYRVGDILKSKEGKVFYKTRDKISSDL